MDDGTFLTRMVMKAVIYGGLKHLAFGPVFPVLLVALVLFLFWRL